jgi:secondary thiamine-phosphate synthase enzyme
MADPLFVVEKTARQLKVASDLVHLRTEDHDQFVDLTDLVAERVRRSGIEQGIVCVQSLHTTAALLVNENEPLLLEDLAGSLDGFAPRGARYAHDDWDRRADVPKGERRNGHAHCQALLLAPAVTLTVMAGRLLLGRWQRVFLVDLDAGRRRGISVVVLGTAEDASGAWS